MQYIAMKRNNGFFLLQCTMKGELVMNQEIAAKIDQLDKIIGNISKNSNCVVKKSQQIEKNEFGGSMGAFLEKTATALVAAGASKAVVLSTIAGFAAGWKIGNEYVTPFRLYQQDRKELKKAAEEIIKNCSDIESALLMCNASLKNVSRDLKSSLKKLETEEYSGLEKRRNSIKKRMKEVATLEERVVSMNKAISSVYIVTKKWLS